MKITKVEQQNRDPRRLSVFIDDSFAFGISAADAALRNICVGMVISKQQLDDIIKDLVLQRAMSVSIKYLSYKSRTEAELHSKLLSKGDYNEEVIVATIEKLKDYGYINDEKYTSDFVYSKATCNLDGFFKIRQQLKLKGIDISDFSNFNVDEISNAYYLIVKKTGKHDFDQRTKKKIYDYLSRKGYSSSVIYAAFKRYGEEIEPEDGDY